jgi:hypothetical protein
MSTGISKMLQAVEIPSSIAFAVYWVLIMQFCSMTKNTRSRGRKLDWI